MARIRDLMAAGPSYSFEFFPPKTDEAERTLEKTVAELAPLHPTFISVTYGALGSTQERTKEVVIRINREQSFPAMAHLTCVGHTRAEVAELLDEYQDNEIENILALGGDPPADGGDPGGEYEFAIQLLEQVRAHDADFSVGVAAHPELHPRSPDRESDRRHLAEKLALADFGVTQFFFDAADHLRMIDELTALGCDTPVVPGVMLFTTYSGLVRMAKMNQAELPDALMERLEPVQEDADEIRRIAVDACTELCQELLDAGVPGLHVYTLNRSEGATQLWENLDLGSR